MPCWETIAETLYEIRSEGKFSDDAVTILIEELLKINVNGISDKIHPIIISPEFGTISDIEEIFQILSHIEEFRYEVGKISAARLLGKRR